MKKIAVLIFTCFSVLLAAAEKEQEIDIRKYHQQLEEKIFERDKEEEQTKKIEEAFQQGKQRIEDLKRNEKELLDMETKAGIDRAEEIEYLDKKYDEVLEKYSKFMDEKEIILLENKSYEEQIKRFDDLEKNLKTLKNN